MRHAALLWVERDGLDFAAGAAGGGGVAEFVEGDDEHFEGPEGPAHVGKVPEEGDDDDVGDYDAEGCFLRFVHAEDAASEEVVRGVGRWVCWVGV